MPMALFGLCHREDLPCAARHEILVAFQVTRMWQWPGEAVRDGNYSGDGLRCFGGISEQWAEDFFDLGDEDTCRFPAW
jgi:hypothetical protein